MHMNKESKKLGRGLSSLLSSHNNRNDNPGDKTFKLINISSVEANSQQPRKNFAKEELETNPIMITDFYKDMLLDFESLGTNTHQIGIGNILHFDARKCNICLEEMKPSHSQKFYKCNKHKGHSRCVKGYYESVRNDSRYICPLRCPKP